jgi:tetratricopeptide (TPR) repeat protein
MPLPCLRPFMCLLALLLAPLLAHAGTAQQAFSRGDPLPPWALPLAEPPTTQRTDPVVLRVAETQIRLDGEVHYLVNRAVQVNDSGALSQIGQYPLYFVPQYQRIRLHSARILRGTQVLDRTAQLSVRFLDREAGLENGIYSGMVTAVLLFDDVRVGDTLHLVYTLEGHNPVLGEHYSHSIAWDHGEPVELRRATLTHPAQRQIAWRMQGDHRPTAITPQELPAPAGWRTRRFEQRGIDGLDDEAATPEDFFAARFLQLTEFADWSAVAQWATGLFPAEPELPAELQPLLAQWRAIASPAERSVAVLRWVQEEIRYFSVSIGESSHRPSPPAEVVQRRYGDCKDKTYLLVSLLRAVGVEADPMLVSLTTPKTPARLLPTPDAFDHVVARARIAGVTWTLDATRLGQRGPLERLGAVLEGAAGLVVNPATTALVTLQTANSRELARNELRERFDVATLGAPAQLQMHQTWSGTNAELMRLAWQRMTPEQRRRQLGSLYERRYPGIRLQGEPLLQDDPTNNRFGIEARFEVPRAASTGPGGGGLLRFAPGNLAGTVRLPEAFARRFPASVMSVPTDVRYHLEVHWPNGFNLSREPQSERLTNPFFDAELQRGFEANVSTIDLQLSTQRATLQPAELPRLAEALKALDHAVAGVVVAEGEALPRRGFLGLGTGTPQDAFNARLDKQIERSGQAIASGQLTDDDLADALCTRAEALAARGRVAEGLADARQAVAEAPVLGRAWLCRADLLFASGEFAAAVPDYGRALSLGVDAFGALYRRGHARFYAGEYDAAGRDFAKAAALRRSDEGADRPHAQLWQLWSALRAGQPAPPELLASAEHGETGRWPRAALAMGVGTLTPEQLLAAAGSAELRLAEAWFHVGQLYQLRGEAAKARAAFETARAKGSGLGLERLAAGFELAAIR